MPSLGLGLGLHRGTAGFRGLLNAYPGSRAALSLRALSSAWKGNDVILVRRSAAGGGDSELGFTEADINNGVMLAWVKEHSATADGLIAVWYDQSGNGNNLAQSTANAQPAIVRNGVKIANGLDFDGTNDELVFSGDGLDIFRNVDYGNVFSVTESDETGQGVSRILDFANNSSSARFLMGDSNSTDASFRIGGRRLDSDSFDSSTSSAVHGSDLKLVTGFLNWADSDAFLYQNGANVATDTSFQTDGSTSGTPSGSAGVGIGAYDGRIAEVIIYNTNQGANRLGIEANMTKYYPIA